ncbi:HEAT repeat-containing protein 2 [Borealophlyctis nickersoniae]|nr:HEAT repeat-containing protein 2 [Borealophlyctis nickersoniae]
MGGDQMDDTVMVPASPGTVTTAEELPQSPALSSAVQQQLNDLLQSLQRDVNILGEQTSDRAAKRRSLERIRRETVDRRSGPLDPRLASAVFAALVKPLLRCFADSVEKCRELSVGLVMSFAKAMDDVTPFLAYIVPVVESRLGQPELVETAEEIRLLLVSLLVELVTLSGPGFGSFVEGTAKILSRALSDPFPDVKKESCKLVMELSKKNARPLSYHGTAIVKALVPSLQHRHSSVRTIGLQGLRTAIEVDASGLDDASDVLYSLTLDKAQSVRETLYVTAGEWLLKLPDRYSIGYKILPLLLSGMTDELPKLQKLCQKYMDDVGALYEQEWESRVKDELDYADKSSDRPRVGARHAARDHTQKIVNKMVEGMSDWNADTRAKSAQILATFLLYVEDQITGYTGVILPILYKILAGDDAHVMSEAVRVAELLGRYVDPDVYIELVTPQIRTGGGGSTQFRIGCLRVLGGLVRGARQADTRLRRYLPALADLLNERELAQNENVVLLSEVASVASEVVGKVPSVTVAPGPTEENAGIGREGYGLFVLLAQLLSVGGNDRIPGYLDLKTKALEALQRLAEAYGLPSTQSLYALHFDTVITNLANSQPQWTRYSAERLLLDTVLRESGPLVGKRLETVLPILGGMAGIERDFEVREGALNILLAHLESPTASINSTGDLPNHSFSLLKDIVITTGVWKPGRKAATLRDLAIKTLLGLVRGGGDESGKVIGLLNADVVQNVLDKELLPILVGTLEDDEGPTRVATLKVFETLLESSVKFDATHFKTIYPEFLKRLDDAHDEIRIETGHAWKSFFVAVKRWGGRMAPLRAAVGAGGGISVLVDAAGNVVPEGGTLVEIGLDDVHWITIVKGMAVHMDDTNPKVQESVCKALQEGVSVVPAEVLRAQLTTVRGRHRNPVYIDSILEKI